MNLPMSGSEAAGTESDAAGFVLAGGKSSRMGTDKALVELDGQPLIAHAVRILRLAGLTPSIAGGQPALEAFAPVIRDRQPDLGPLSGICAALASCPAQWAVFLPVDLPLLPASLLVSLLQRTRVTCSPVTLSSVNGFAQTFPAVIHRSALPDLQQELDSGRGSCFSAFRAATAATNSPLTPVQVESLVQCGQVSHPRALPACWWFLNVNTAENLLRARVLSQALIA